MNKVALITGITGQDGSYLADLLLTKGYTVHGIVRRSSTVNTGRLADIYVDPHEEDGKLKLHYGDLADSTSLHRILEKTSPDEIYHLGAQSHVRVSFDAPDYTADVTGMGTLRLLEAIKTVGLKTRFYQAGSSEMFGGLYHGYTILDEKCQFHPRSPYGCAKVFAHNIAVNYRESYGMYISNGILFNHESPRRGITFVTRKITRYVAQVIKGTPDGKLYLGNLAAKRDWGYAPEYVKAMWMMLQQDKPSDYVIATARTHSVEDFLDATFGAFNLPWKTYVEIDPRYFRPAEVDVLIGDPSKAHRDFGWKSTVDMAHLARIMVNADLSGENMQEVRKLWTH